MPTGLPAEERVHVATALVGLAGCAAGSAWLLARARTAASAFALGLFCAGFLALFAATALHHARPASVRWRRLDHALVFVAIACGAAPLCLLVLGGWLGAAALGLLGIVAIAGAALKLGRCDRPPWVELALYAPAVVLAAALVVALAPVVPPPGAGLLASAGALFVLGGVADAAGRPSPPGLGSHGLLHLGALLGVALLFAFVAVYVPA